MSLDFEGRVVLVTGAASGIGRAAAHRFSQEGAKVCLFDLDGNKAMLVADALDGETHVVSGDVTIAADNERMVAECEAKFGRLDCVFLNAGYLGPLDHSSGVNETLFDQLIAVNLKGAFLGLRAVMDRMHPGGSVVVTASTASLIGLSESPAYSAAKHGVLGLVKSLSPAFAERQLRLNAICPGAVDTPMIGGGGSESILPPSQLAQVPFKGVGSAQHVAECALWLASHKASFVHGQGLTVDAGLMSTFSSSS